MFFCQGLLFVFFFYLCSSYIGAPDLAELQDEKKTIGSMFFHAGAPNLTAEALKMSFYKNEL